MSFKQILILAIITAAVFYGYKEYTGKNLMDTVSEKTKSVVADTRNATIRVAESRKALTEQTNDAMND